VIGIYGVMGYYVQQHLKAISIRMALGGSQADVARLVVGQGMTLVGIGIGVGGAVAFGAARLMSSLLFNVGTSDPSAYAGAGTVLFVVAGLACAVPALRAMRLPPARVLRNE
jgi:putative ABC transport system permease protein